MLSPRRLLRLAVALLLAPLAEAQFDYSLSFDTARRTWSVEGTFPSPDGGELEYWIARWTPGAYHVADYGRFVEDLRARTPDGEGLSVERVDESHWRIDAGGAERVVVSYTAEAISFGVFTNEVLDVESNRVTRDYAYVTPVSLFGFVPGREQEPFSLRVTPPEGWKAATVLERDAEGVFHAPSYYRFEDSPLLFSPRLETVGGEVAGKPLYVTIHGKRGLEVRELVEGCLAIARSAAALMGGSVPYERYHFLLVFAPDGQGSGLEHSDSTLIVTSSGMRPTQAWGIIAHEYFHLWCAERIHTESIRDPDYTEPNVTGTIWVNESITEYFTQHVLLHAGLLERDELLGKVAAESPMLDMMSESLGAITDVSRAAVRWDSMSDLMSFAMKMYHQGPRIVFALDMEMRRQSGGERGILDLLHHLDREYAAKGRGFPEDGMLPILNEVAGGDLSSFYERFIAGAENPDPAAFLDVIGFEPGTEGVLSVSDPTPAQLEARADFFSIEG